MVYGMGVMQERRNSYLFGGESSPSLKPFLQYQDLQPGFGKVSAGTQPVGAGTDDYDIVFMLSLFHRASVLWMAF